MSEPVITRNDDTQRYEIALDGSVAGFVDFTSENGVTRAEHTEVLPEYAGQGLAGKLVGFMLADLAERGEAVVPACSYVAKYVATHDIPGLKIAS